MQVTHNGKLYSKHEELQHIVSLLEGYDGTEHEFLNAYMGRDRNQDPEWLQKMHGYWGTDKRKTFLKQESIYHDESGNWKEDK